jgi:hypothetical protein
MARKKAVRVKDFNAVIEAAFTHGNESAPDMTAGDLEAVAREMFILLTPDQKRALMATDVVQRLLTDWGDPLQAGDTPPPVVG